MTNTCEPPTHSPLMSISDAQALLARVPALTLAELKRPLAHVLNYRLSQSITASLAVPPEHNSAMDGYAVCSAELVANGFVLPISQRIAAGTAAVPLAANSCARIFTGAPLPANADAVVIQEDTELTDDGRVRFIVDEEPKHFDNVRPKGQDIEQGSLLAAAGSKITPALLGLLASQGLNDISVQAPLKIALVSTGDEIINPGLPLQAGQIYNSNRYAIGSLLNAWGVVELRFYNAKDSLIDTRNTLQKAAEASDLVISFGGVSVGEEDHIKAAVNELGHVEHWKINLKPGKPLMFGHLGVTPILGLPGNPVSAFVTFLLFGKTLLAALCNSPQQSPLALPLPLGFAINKPRRRPEFIRASIENGQIMATGNQSSGVLSSLYSAEGLAFIPDNQTFKHGDSVAFYPLNDLIHG